ncbi:hypothetical protein CAPTEDRAFT_162470 [Capitella teleta]|uniref:RNA ligase 1 n=1 Tax=Capitella teleta TaxID=283909 RepID=R7T4D4_CAPTE|nr:hypothetical protein CAPTEDRAFT_162470 [Capitella teleta]|eukprot:ELT87748.1 hypothetical protein CAPTEDRAFT_162470 [Capitella teleta]
MNQVQQKVSCAFETEVISGESSLKRPHQSFKVIASTRLKASAVESDIENGACSEKIDGTCTFVALHNDRPWLWARLDRKPTKSIEKKFKKYQQQLRNWEQNPKGKERPPDFHWDAVKDFKEAPDDWIPAHRVPIVEGIPQPDRYGHMPGWLPLAATARQYCWHLDTVQLDAGLCLLLEQKEDQLLEVRVERLDSLKDCTLELIGTNVNGNPYLIGSKAAPLHILVQHGSIAVSRAPSPEYDALVKWFNEDSDSAVEGLVWRCANGMLYKVHRHHLQLPWPLEQKPRLCRSAVTINVDLSLFTDVDFEEKPLFTKLGRLHGKTYDSLCDIQL